MLSFCYYDMAKRKKKVNFAPLAFFHNLRDETKQSIWAIVFLVVALFFILSPFGWAGSVGKWIYDGLFFIFGVGFFLLPLLLFLLSFSLLSNREQDLGSSRTIGALLFFFSGLGLIDLAALGDGGKVGMYISLPLTSLFGSIAATILLLAFVIISFLIILDVGISFAPFKKLRFKKKEKDIMEDTAPEDAEGDEDEEYDEEEYEDEEYEDGEEEDEEDEGEKPSLAKRIFGGKTSKSSGTFGTVHTDTYIPPPLSLLEKDRGKPGHGNVKANANIIKRTFQNFGIHIEMDEVSIGPSVTRYAIKPAEGVRLSKIIGLQNNLELALAAHPVRIEAPIPGKSLVGIEVPNSAKTTIGLASMLSSLNYQESEKPLMVALGKDIAGEAHFANLGKMPHLLLAGATGSGKSVTIHSIITSLLYRNSPQQMRFIMIDPKRVELTLYNNIPHLMTPVITNAKKTILALRWAAKEMDRRYDILEAEAVRDIESFHQNVLVPALKKFESKEEEEVEVEELPETMPYIVIVIDELADIMQTYPRELEAAIVRLAQMSRAVGIHLILSTQRPSVNIITGLIKANIPARIALQVASQIDSRTILDASGAEKLLGAGDMLYLSGEMSKPRRIQAPFISETEVKKVVKYLQKNYEDELPDEIQFTAENTSNSIFQATLDDAGAEEDEHYEEAREIVIYAGKASTSYLQRKLRIGYARAARLMDILEDRGVIGPADGAKPREILERSPNEEEGEYNEREEV